MNSKNRNCDEPKCYYSTYRNKCIKPNAYIEYISWCKYNSKSCNKPREEYKNKTDEIKQNTCNYYKENIKNRKPLSNTCPNKRTPKNNICPSPFPILKLNKHNIECCYKEKSKEKSKEKFKEKSKEKSKEKLINGKMAKIIYKYQNKEKGKKVFT